MKSKAKAVAAILSTQLSLQGKEQEKPAKPAVNISATASSADEVMQLIKDRRSVFPKDYTGQLVDRYVRSCTWAIGCVHV